MAEVKYKSVLTTLFDYQAEVEWNLTMRCNYSCSYCESYDNTIPTNFKSLDDYTTAIKTLNQYLENKKARIEILGGEPMLYKHWNSLLNLIFEYGHLPKICTNLSINNKTLKKKLENLYPKQCIDVSWHTQFAEEDKIVENIKTIHESNHLRTISILADKRYWDKVKSAYNRVKHFDNVELSYIKDESAGKNNIASGLIEYSKEEINYIERVNNVNKFRFNFETKVLYNSGKVDILNNITDFFEKDVNNFKGMNCDVGKLRLHIKSNGDVYPSACLLNYPKAKMGNLYQGTIIKPKKAIKCPFSFCGCGPDLRINKYE